MAVGADYVAHLRINQILGWRMIARIQGDGMNARLLKIRSQVLFHSHSVVADQAVLFRNCRFQQMLPRTSLMAHVVVVTTDSRNRHAGQFCKMAFRTYRNFGRNRLGRGRLGNGMRRGVPLPGLMTGRTQR